MTKLKKIGLLLGISLLTGTGIVRAQSVSQLVTQLTLDIQKLTTMKTLLNDLYAGYAVLDKGYTDIRNIVQGNFNLHKAFLDGLLAVSPLVSGYYRAADIIQTESAIVSEYRSAWRQWTSDGHFAAWELDHIGQVYAGLLDRTLKYLDKLAMVISNGELRMSDAERLNAIDRIYVDINSQLTHLRQFNTSLSILSGQRSQEANDLKTIKGFYGTEY